MPKHSLSGSESEEDNEETPENSGSDSEPEDPQPQTPSNNGVSEYEKQRLSRIAENRARMEALGLPKFASSLLGSAQKVRNNNNKNKNKKKGKEKVDDDDYRPDEVEDELSSSSEEEKDDDEDEDYSSGSRRKKVRNKDAKPKKKVPAHKGLSKSDYIDNDDAVRQAIALSLQESAGLSGVVHCGPSKCSEADVVNANLNEKKGHTRIQEDTGKRKRKKLFASRVQMTEDELVVNFYQFDDTWKGGITVRDIERVSNAHDFMWTKQELSDMIHCFDSDRDGKLSLEDFRKIVGRCNMIKGPESS
ncbi:protein IWS1 homolog [Quercus lobata]|uniref:EF-hand domain-containing protein n=1 Tax=Quercus lobata TaxID=97700 RepID=A0A7N2LF31_QUELO|nr:protein IWS1 homolog [Quercus lobata]